MKHKFEDYSDVRRDKGTHSHEEMEERARKRGWACVYCGNIIDEAANISKSCCKETGHVEEVYLDTGEPV
jgi:hypothetical protein